MVIFLFLLTIMMTIFFISPLHLRFIVKHNKNETKVTIQFGLFWNVVKFKLSLKSLEKSIKKFTTLFQLDNAKTLNKEQKIDSGFLGDMSFIKDIWKIKNKIIPPVQCEQLIWITKVGCKDAAVTGLTTGLLWSIKGIVYGTLKQFKKWQVKKTHFKVATDFDKNNFELLIDCIFILKIGHIIFAGIKLCGYILLFILKGGVIGGRSSNRGFDENSYGKY